MTESELEKEVVESLPPPKPEDIIKAEPPNKFDTIIQLLQNIEHNLKVLHGALPSPTYLKYCADALGEIANSRELIPKVKKNEL